MLNGINIIPLLFLLPAGLCILLILFRSRVLNAVSLLLYPVVYLAGTVKLYLYPEAGSPYFQSDPLNLFFMFVLGIVFFTVTLYHIRYLRHSKALIMRQTVHVILFLLFVVCMTGVLLSQHLGLLWVFVEATTLISAPLISYEKSKSSLEATWKYIFICSIGISLAFVGIILLTLSGGPNNSLFFSDLYRNASLFSLFWLKLSLPFILIGFGTKMGLAPVHAWLPDAHSEAPSPVSAMLSGTLLNTALFAILKINKIMQLAGLGTYSHVLFLLMGFMSIFVSAVFILRTNNYKRMLAYSSIENMGIITIAMALGGAGAFAGFLHIAAHSFSKVLLFLTAGNILHQYNTKEVSRVEGILRQDKMTGWLWIMGFIFIAGFPPGPGFISEILMVKSFLNMKYIVLMALFVLLLTFIIFGLARTIFKMSFGQGPVRPAGKKYAVLEYLPQIILIIVLAVIGIFMPDIIYRLIQGALGCI
ncbi:MAG: proton-conducting transporter membrane subunit [bacterium]|nr:proton-conducting transporter membrane subunit [bacterium]